MIELLIIGGLLCGFGGIIMITTIPWTGWDTSWEETKEAFRTMIHNRRFQISFSCFLIGFLMVMYWFSIVL